MRIVVHDYCGHPFQVQLSRCLAHRGHEVLHLYCGSFVSPHGDLKAGPGDAPTFAIEPIMLSRPVPRSDYVKRTRSDLEHGRLAAKRIKAFGPDLVIVANSTMPIVGAIQKECRRLGAKYVFWVQDLIGLAAQRAIKGKMGGLGNPIGQLYANWERRQLARADSIVVIAEDFKQFLPKSARKVATIENWSPLDDLPQRPKDNEWAKQNGLAETTNFFYTGTLGLKHQPELLVKIAMRYRDDTSVRVVVISSEDSLEFIRRRAHEEKLSNLIAMPFQPFEAMPNVLGTADVLIAVLEPEAGVFSVPSKVLTYLCAGRAILLAVPPENLAAKIVKNNGAGVGVPPTDPEGFVKAAESLMGDPKRREEMGRSARAYAEKTFEAQRITDRFETEVFLPLTKA